MSTLPPPTAAADRHMLSRLPASRLYGEERNAFHAVLPRCFLGPLRDEAVLVVLLDVVELEAGAFDRVAVVVALHRAADTGGPEGGVAGHADRQLCVRDDVRDRKPAARA